MVLPENYFLLKPGKVTLSKNYMMALFLDKLFGTGDDKVKVSYTVIMGLSLFMLILSGLWLWYGPKYLRKSRKQ